MDKIVNALSSVSKYGKYIACAIVVVEFAIREIKRVQAGEAVDNLATLYSGTSN